MKIQDAERILRKPRRTSLTLDGLIGLVFVILLAVLLLFVVGTITRFIPAAGEIKAAQESMQSEIDRMNEDLTRISEAVDAWPGITVLTEEEIPDLAGNGETQPMAASIEYLGEFKITAYCACEKCCGKWSGLKLPNGLYPEQGRTCAADLSVLPRGTKIEIEGLGERIVEDTGSAVKGNHIDVFFDSHEEALQFGLQTLDVWRVKP